MYNQFVRQNNKSTNNPTQKWARDPNGLLVEETLQMASGRMHGNSLSSAIRDLLIETKATQQPLE